MSFTYHWWYRTPLEFVKRELGFACHTIIDWASFCREVCVDQVMNSSTKIGGVGVLVESDESKFWKIIDY